MRVVSLFAGIGGFDLALTRLGHEIVYANEWDKYAAQTYEKNFGHKPDTRDIRTITETEIPNHRLLVGGFPCQAFSIAGKRRGFEDTRGTLFFEIARILKYQRPSYLLLENVKGLLSHDNGRTFETILRTLNELGYDTQWQVVNSKNFGVPQNRERVFIVGHFATRVSRPKVFPITSQHPENKGEVVTTLMARDYKGVGNQEMALACQYDAGQAYRVYKKSGISPTVSTPSGGNHIPKIEENMKIRRLTPTECERLQGFPDGWTEGVSDTQRYKQLGNAVTVNVVEEIVRRLSFN